MPIRLSERATEAYAYPLLIKQLLQLSGKLLY